MDLNILNREFPVSDSVKSTVNVQRGLYSIADNFFSFWYRFIFPNLSELEAGDVDGVFEFSIKPFLDSFASKAFENICIQYLRTLNAKGLLPIRFKKIGRWWEKDCEIDIMAIGAKEESVVAECKWQISKVGMSDYEHLKNKATGLKITQPYFYLFSKSGFNEQLMKFAETDKFIKLVWLNEIDEAFKD